MLPLRRYERISTENWRFRSNVVSFTQNFYHSSSQKTRLNDLAYGINIWTDLSSVLSQIAGLTDGQSDERTYRQTAFSWLDRAACNASCMQQGKNKAFTEKCIVFSWLQHTEIFTCSGFHLFPAIQHNFIPFVTLYVM